MLRRSEHSPRSLAIGAARKEPGDASAERGTYAGAIADVAPGVCLYMAPVAGDPTMPDGCQGPFPLQVTSGYRDVDGVRWWYVVPVGQGPGGGGFVHSSMIAPR